MMYISERRSSMQIGSTTITPLTKQEQLTLNCDSDNLSERDEAEAEVFSFNFFMPFSICNQRIIFFIFY